VSGYRVASYELSAAAQAALREAQRLAAARRRWQGRQRDRARMVGLLVAQARGVDLLDVAAQQLGQPASWDEKALAEAESGADAETAALRAELTRVRRAKTEKMAAERFRDIGGSTMSSPPVPVAAAPARARETGDDVLRRAERYASRLDPDAEPPDALPELMARIRTASTSADVLLSRLQDLVEEANRAHRATLVRQAAEEVLDAARTLLAETGDPDLGAVLAVQEAEHVAGRPVDVVAVRAVMDAAEARELEQRTKRFVLLTMVDALADQNYEPITDFMVHRPVDGELVRVDGRGHAVRITVDDQIRMEPVRLEQREEQLSADERSKRDKEADTEVCAAITRAFVEVSEEDGIMVRSASPRAAGLVSLEAVPVSSGVPIERDRSAKATSQKRRKSRRRGVEQRVKEMDIR
jgi:hypothetical protein